MGGSRVTALGIVLLLCLILSVSSSAFAWNSCSNLSLPLPLPLPVIALFLPIAFIICIYPAVFLRSKGYDMFKAFPTVLVYIAITTLVVLFTLSSIYFTPTPLRAFSLEWTWDQLFRSKNESAIQLIQAQLKCCGLSNMHDRAWPFPGKGIGAYECEKSQGWDKSCLSVWRKSLIIASSLSAMSDIAGLICVLCISIILDIWPHSYNIAEQKKNPSTTTGLSPSHGVRYGTQNQSSSMGSENLQEHQRAAEPQEIGCTEPDQYTQA